ncbi:MAG TPA: outer membrane beta-barrel protein [Bryobacteraceae bacterium]|jgi:hypothetical protein|nr:outer membrane beta-barrel protein [Bryobacteraceae bacterium]
MRTLTIPLLLLSAVLPAAAQKYEFGIGGGGSFYTSQQVKNPRGNADAGFNSGAAITAHFGHNTYRLIGGEIRYNYLRNDSRLEGTGGTATMGGEAHVIHYDILVHTASNENRVRPYFSFGGGVKLWRGTGAERVTQANSSTALLTKTSEHLGLISFGAGVKYRVTPKMALRVDIRDYLTPFPREIIEPNVGSNVSGWLHNIVPTASLVFLW